VIDKDELSEFHDSLTRWREACLFYFKLDLALVVAIGALLSYLKMQGSDILIAAYQYRLVINILAGFIAYALIFQMLLTDIANKRGLSSMLKDPRWSKTILIVFRYMYIVQTLAHLSLLLFVTGFISGSSDAFVSHIKSG